MTIALDRTIPRGGATAALATLALLTSFALASVPAPASAAERFEATLDGAQAGTPALGTGTAVLILNDAGTEVAYDIEYTGLVGTETMAHIHQGGPGTFGPILLTLPLGTPKTGTWLVGPHDVEYLRTGQTYVNIHTDLYPEGELRGNIAFITVPSAATTWGGIKTLYR